MTCPFLKDGRCSLAEQCAKNELGLLLECRPDESVCAKCLAAGEPSEEKPSLPCMGLVTKQVPKDRMVEWVKFTTWIHHGKSRGIGDTIAKGLATVGVKKKKGCGCAARQKALNKLAPYKAENR